MPEPTGPAVSGPGASGPLVSGPVSGPLLSGPVSGPAVSEPLSGPASSERASPEPASSEHGQGPAVSVVVPTVGRPSLARLLQALAAASGPRPDAVIVVDDRPVEAGGAGDLPLGDTDLPVKVLQSGGAGPAAARNTGWRATTSPWVAFLDDDVVPSATWLEDLAADLDGLHPEIAGSQGRIEVPLPADRRPTDWERNTRGLETACWATADLAYRRDVLDEVGGFDERFPRAFREDADLGLRVHAAGYLIVRGERLIRHPVRPAGPLASVRAQAGNADDVLMRALHGPGWRLRAAAEPGRTGRHLLTTAGAVAAVGGALLPGRHGRLALAGAAVWAAGTAELAAVRIAPGPRQVGEIATMLGTSCLLPVAATAHRLRGWARVRSALRDRDRAPLGVPRSPLALSPPRLWTRPGRRARPVPVDPEWRAEAVLFDRDGTLVVDVPYNGDPDAVRLMPGARLAVARARRAGLAVGVVTNQSAIGTGRLTPDDVTAVDRRIEELLGPIQVWAICPHRPDDGCDCRKPAPGLVRHAAAALGVDPARCAVIGDIGADVAAARAAGARSVLVPNRVTRGQEIAAAGAVAADLLTAVDYVVAGTC
ncbi:MAG TPA: HAD-IIIA family hydrolase [Acidimicrobiales bacterium]|nr:HAD-IIIA family hydrolase [Acidimicrobiales bacterium]